MAMERIEKAPMALLKADPHSYAEPDKVRIRYLDLNITPDFEKKILQGCAEYTLKWQDKNAETLVLDTRELSIDSVEALTPEGTWVPVTFESGKQSQLLGTALHININASHQKVKINYTTSPNAKGLQWLEPSQTGTKTHPFLYSESEPIEGRSWLPSQDTPAVRFRYKACINTPEGLRAVMSAKNDPDHPLGGSFTFEMEQAVPSYLVAFAVGNLEAKRIGPRSFVYAEPDRLEEAASEFEHTEKMIEAASKFFGPYRWGTFDLLVLPPSFPMGGMENPRLTFLTPTIIVGDKSLVGVLAHELAHSWSGNLVTNASWEDVWLNEGTTTYVQNRLIEELYGKEAAAIEFREGIIGLNNELKDLKPEDQRLALDLQGRDPQVAFSDVAYKKGAWFFKTLEEKFGRERFDAFLCNYFNDHAFESVTTQIFKDYLQIHLIDAYPGIYSMEEVEEWIHQPGIPQDAKEPESERLNLIEKNKEIWLASGMTATELGAETWSSNEWRYFLGSLPKPLQTEKLKDLDKSYHLSGMKNSVVAASWYALTISSYYHEAEPALEQHLLTVGRRYLIASLYKALLETEEGALFAKRVYEQAKPLYHAKTRGTIEGFFEAREKKLKEKEELEAKEAGKQEAPLSEPKNKEEGFNLRASGFSIFESKNKRLNEDPESSPSLML